MMQHIGHPVRSGKTALTTRLWTTRMAFALAHCTDHEASYTIAVIHGLHRDFMLTLTAAGRVKVSPI